MTIELTPRLKKAIILIDPYYSQKQEKIALEISVNRMMSLREEAGLEPKEKGRPKGLRMTFKGEENTMPKEIIDSTNIGKIDIKIQKLLTVYPDTYVDGQKLRFIKYNLLYEKLEGKTAEEQLQIIKDFNHEQSRIEEFNNN